MHDDLLQLYQKRFETNFQQEVSSPWNSRDFVPKKVLPFQPDSRGRWTPNYEGPCTMTLVTADRDKPARFVNVSAVKKYSIKK